MIIEKDGKTWELHDKTHLNIFLKQGWNIAPGQQPEAEPVPEAKQLDFDEMPDEELVEYAEGIGLDTSKVKNRDQLLKMLRSGANVQK